MKRDLTERLEVAFMESGIVKGFADPIYNFMNKAFQETPLRPLKLLANGAWLEHSLHPVFTDIPIGAWTVALVLGLVALVFGRPELGLAVGITMGLGILVASATILTGLFDWMDVDPPEKAVGFVHGTINILATIAFLISFLMLWNSSGKVDIYNWIVALVGYAIVLAGGFLGGSLVFRMGVMVNRDAYRSGPKEMTQAIALADLPENQLERVEVKGQPILLLRRADKVYAIGAVCSHYAGPLEKGKLLNANVECPYHYSQFSLADGRVRQGPATAPVPAYEVQIANGQILVKIRK